MNAAASRYLVTNQYNMHILSLLLLLLLIPTSSSSPSPSSNNDALDLFHDPYPPFLSGVASGEPLPTSILIWTKIHPPTNNYTDDISIQWILVLTTTNNVIQQQGIVLASSINDYCITVEISNLLPYTKYQYYFQTLDGKNKSRIGYTKTAPDISTEEKTITFASLSCSSLWGGFFKGYYALSTRDDIDVVFHLGDLIYPELDDSRKCMRVPAYLNPNCHRSTCTSSSSSSSSSSNSLLLSPECEELAKKDPCDSLGQLAKFRWIHQIYLLDPAYRAARAAHPWIVLADNHDLDSNRSTNITTTGALKAFFEYVPSRLYEPSTMPQGNTSLFRRFTYGKYVDILSLDTRAIGLIETPSTYLGQHQLSELRNALLDSAKRNTSARILLSTVAFAPWNIAGWENVVDEIFVAPFLFFVLMTCGVGYLFWTHYRKQQQLQQNLLDEDSEKQIHHNQQQQQQQNSPITLNVSKQNIIACLSSKCCFIYCLVSLLIIIISWIIVIEVADKYINVASGREGISYNGLSLIAAAGRNWDGHPTDRQNLLLMLNETNTDQNNIWLTGDMHTFVIADVRDALSYSTLANTGKRYGVELMAGSLSRGNPTEVVSKYGIPPGSLLNTASNLVTSTLQRLSPWLRYVEGQSHGFGILKITEEQIIGEIWFSSLERTSWYRNFSLFVPELTTTTTTPSSTSAFDSQLAVLGKRLVMKYGKNMWEEVST
jgi:phosphodiesterase/alkaline phosphatase D-like protein